MRSHVSPDQRLQPRWWQARDRYFDARWAAWNLAQRLFWASAMRFLAAADSGLRAGASVGVGAAGRAGLWPFRWPRCLRRSAMA
jgi:hypothetical protein